MYTEETLGKAAEKLRAGELIAFPTETVYGLGANALLPESVATVFTVKGRPSDNPLIVHVESFQRVKEYVDNFHPLTEKIVEHFWPGPLTLIFSIKKNSLPAEVTGGLSTAAFRMPNNKKTLALIEKADVPMVGPSANTSGRPSPTTAEHVFHDLAGKISGILNDGATQIGVESTVLDLSDPLKAPMILRPGGVSQEELEAVLGVEVLVDQHLVEKTEAPKAPGMKYKHYAPTVPVMIVEKEKIYAALAWGKQQQFQMGLVASPSVVDNYRGEVAVSFSYGADSIEAATQGLFAGLRALDLPILDVIFVEAFPEKDLGVAYMNRLKKAAGERFFAGD